MATAKARMVIKTRQITETYEERDGVVLDLTKDEANMLAALLGFQTGGANKDVMSVYKALKSQLNVYGTDVTRMMYKMTGMVRVTN